MKYSNKKLLAAFGLALVMAVSFSPHGALMAEDSPELKPITTSGICDDLDNIPVGSMVQPLLEPLAPWRITQKYNTSENDPHYGLGHNGVDLGGEFTGGTAGVEQVRNVFSGKVLISGFRGGWGNSIVVVSKVHPSSSELITTHYHHLHVRYVSHCDIVTPNQLFGKEGKTGDPTYLAHLHFTVRHWASLGHLKNWLAKQDGDYLVFGNDAYFGHNGKEFRGSYEPTAASIDSNSPYYHYGHLNPIALVHDFYSDYGDGNGNVDQSLPESWWISYAKKMRYYGIELGEWDGAFGATTKVKRREAAHWLRIAIGSKASGTSTGAQIFNDVASKDPDYDYIQQLTQYPPQVPVVNPDNSCTQGNGHNFCPDTQINRAEALKMIITAFYANEFLDFQKKTFWVKTAVTLLSTLESLLGLPVNSVLNTVFSDVDINVWYAPYVYFGALKGIVKVNQKFNPGMEVLRAEMSKWIVLGYEKLNGKAVADPCAGKTCASSEYCDPQTGACTLSMPCVPMEGNPCEVGGGLGFNSPQCPNAVCEFGETCTNCSQDCGACPPGCPDGTCGSGESCSTCPQDCGACPPSCPDGLCNGAESCSSCPQDCGACQAACPDGQCNGSETCMLCPQDCGQCPCMASGYWSPALVGDTDSLGSQAAGSINTAIKVEVQESGTGLQARVCKPGGTFSNDIAFSIYDGATNSSVGATIANLATANQACSGWVALQNDTNYGEGQVFGGNWQVVSPAGSANDWSWPYASCPVNGSPTGTCWNGINITLTRTCK